ncbi:MAG: O-antigen ligase [Pseudomonadota bacterium]
MSNTEIPRIDTQRVVTDQAVTLGRTLAASVGLLLMWLSFEPFNGGRPFEQGGSLINQIGYTGLVGLLLIALVVCVPPRVASRLISLPWLMLFGWVIFSGLFVSAIGDVAMRGALFSVIVALMAALIVVCLPSERALLTALAVAASIILGLSYAGLVLLPDGAVHTAFEAEPQHSGLWRGVFVHKNVAGPAMALVMFSGIYVARRYSLTLGLMIAFSALLFVFQTGSKTSLALAPLVLGMVLVPIAFGFRFLVPIIAVISIVMAHALTLGTIYFDAFDGIVRTISPDTTFTGRTEIWTFANKYLFEKPITGFGYAGFWTTDYVLNAEQPFDRSWDPRGIIHGHNGYLDALLIFGVPGLVLITWVTIFSPAYQYAFAVRTAANDAANDFFYMIAVFAALNSSLESFFFNRADPVWLTLVFALFGLRLASWLRISKA